MPIITTPEPQMPLPSTVTVAGDALRTRRVELGLTLTTVAERSDITFQYLSQLERGTRREMGPPAFRRLVEALEMTGRADELKAAA